MNLLRTIFTGPGSRRPRRIIGAVALLITWSFFGTVNNVMHVGSYLMVLLWLVGSYVAICLFLWARRQSAAISADKLNERAAEKEKLERAA